MKKTILFPFCLLLLNFCFGQPEFLDPDFGNNGIQVTTIPKGPDYAQQLLLLPDGKTLIIGTSEFDGDTEISLAQYLSDGSLDEAFGMQGTVIAQEVEANLSSSFSTLLDATILPDGKIATANLRYIFLFESDGTFVEKNNYASSTQAKAIFQPDGKLVKVGSSSGEIRIERFQFNGELDPSFTPLSLDLSASLFQINSSSLFLYPDGKLLFGIKHNDQYAIARILSDGSLDNSFGTDGIVYLDAVDGKCLTGQSDGKILVGGSVGIEGFFVTRLNDDGSPDESFGVDGTFISDHASAIVQLSQNADGSILGLGEEWEYDPYNNLIIKLTPTGLIDENFGINGLTTVESQFSFFKKQDDQQIVLAGTIDEDFALSRLTTEGSLDPDFNGGETRLTNLGNSDGSISRIASTPGGNLVVAGYLGGVFGNPSIAQFDTYGNLDAGFNDFNLINTVPGDFVSNMLVQTDGKIIVGGARYGGNLETGLTDGSVIRLHPDGTRDTSFTTVYTGPLLSMAQQPDGKLLLTGYGDGMWAVGAFLERRFPDGSLDLSFAPHSGVSLANWKKVDVLNNGNVIVGGRTSLYGFLPNGSVDEDFGTDGTLNLDFGGVNENIISMVVQDDQKILVLVDIGTTHVLARFHPDGMPDESFGDNGVVHYGTDITIQLSAMALTADQKIVLAGLRREMPWSESPEDFYLALLLPDGSLDSSAVNNGVAIIDLGADEEYARAIAVQADGKIILAGVSDDKFAVIRFLPDLMVDAIEVENSKGGQLLIAPNPASHSISIELPESATRPLDLFIYSSEGKLVKQQQYQPNQLLAVDQLPDGIYIVLAKDGEKVYSSRFVKE